MSRGDGWYGPSKPIAVEGGVKARSKRGAIGEQWWSARFIAALESYGMSGRLQRGRAYARKGQVIEFSLGVGKVTARVQGSRAAPYKVSIGVLPLTSAQWKTVESRLASQALFRAKLLAGEMPAEIEQVFADCGTPLFPRSATDLDMHCSCPDWEVPCKHLAAVCYVLAEAFDDDPFEMLAWRGRGRDTLLAALRRTGPRRSAGSPETGARGRAGARAGAPAADMDAAGTSATRAVLADVTGAPLAQAGDFWSPGLSQARLRALAAPGVATAAPDLLLRMFDPPPLMVRGKDLRTVLSTAYEQLGGHADSELSVAAMPVKVGRVVSRSRRHRRPSLADSMIMGRPPRYVRAGSQAGRPGRVVAWPAPDLIAVSAAIATETAIKSPVRGYIPGISGTSARMSGQHTTREAHRSVLLAGRLVREVGGCPGLVQVIGLTARLGSRDRTLAVREPRDEPARPGSFARSHLGCSAPRRRPGRASARARCKAGASQSHSRRSGSPGRRPRRGRPRGLRLADGVDPHSVLGHPHPGDRLTDPVTSRDIYDPQVRKRGTEDRAPARTREAP